MQKSQRKTENTVHAATALDTSAPTPPATPSLFTPRAMPYTISPDANARCMRSRVTISRITFHHTRGPARTTGHGSNTPTQLEWRHVGRVGAVQSARSMAE